MWCDHSDHVDHDHDNHDRLVSCDVMWCDHDDHADHDRLVSCDVIMIVMMVMMDWCHVMWSWWSWWTDVVWCGHDGHDGLITGVRGPLWGRLSTRLLQTHQRVRGPRVLWVLSPGHFAWWVKIYRRLMLHCIILLRLLFQENLEILTDTLCAQACAGSLCLAAGSWSPSPGASLTPALCISTLTAAPLCSAHSPAPGCWRPGRRRSTIH